MIGRALNYRCAWIYDFLLGVSNYCPLKSDLVPGHNNDCCGPSPCLVPSVVDMVSLWSNVELGSVVEVFRSRAFRKKRNCSLMYVILDCGQFSFVTKRLRRAPYAYGCILLAVTRCVPLVFL